jgi:predicted Zn-dependent protease
MKKRCIIGLIILFVLSGTVVSAEKCPKKEIPVDPSLHAVIVGAKKEMEKGRNQEALRLLTDHATKNDSKTHPQIPFLKGLAEYRLKRLEKSEALFKKAVELNPCFGEAWQNLAVLYYEEKRPAQAADAMARAFTLIKPENRDLQYQSAVFWLMADKPEKALPTLEQLTKKDPTNKKWLISLAQTRKAMGQNAKAAAILEKAYKRDRNPDLLYECALLRISSKEYKKAILLLQELIKQPNPKRSWFLLLADTLEKGKKPVEAAKVLQKAAKRFNATDLQYRAALLYLHSKKPGSALPLLKGLTSQKSVKPQWLTALSLVYVRLSQPEKAAESLEKVIRLKPNAAHQYQAACLWVEAGRPEKALPLLKDLCAKSKVSPQWRASLAHVLEKLGKTDEAARVLAEGKEGEEVPADRFRSALLYLKEGTPKKALPILEALAKTAHPNPQWLVALAATLDRLHRPDEASAVMEKVGADAPALSAKMRLQMAVFWLRHDQPKRALRLLEQLAKDPHATKECLMAYIEALVRTGSAKGADAPLERLLNRYPQSEEIWRLAAWTAIEQKNYGKAAAALEVAFRLRPPKPGDWKRLGNLYRLAGVPRKAAEAYIKAFGKTPTADDLDLLACTYQEAHQMDKALAAANRAAKLKPSAKRFSRLGQMYMAQDDCEKGMEAFQKAAQLDDSGGANSLKVGYAAWKLDRLACAKTAFQSALKNADSKSDAASKATCAIETIEQMMKRQPAKKSPSK